MRRLRAHIRKCTGVGAIGSSMTRLSQIGTLRNGFVPNPPRRRFGVMSQAGRRHGTSRISPNPRHEIVQLPGFADTRRFMKLLRQKLAARDTEPGFGTHACSGMQVSAARSMKAERAGLAKSGV